MSQFPNASRYVFILSKSNIKRLGKGIEILPSITNIYVKDYLVNIIERPKIHLKTLKKVQICLNMFRNLTDRSITATTTDIAKFMKTGNGSGRAHIKLWYLLLYLVFIN